MLHAVLPANTQNITNITRTTTHCQNDQLYAPDRT